MPIVSLVFTQPINVSCQVGDTAYYVNTEAEGGFNVATDPDGDGADNIIEIGQIREISGMTLFVDTNLGYDEINGITAFILFSKNNKANLSSPLGYYASVKLINDSTTEAELHSVAMDVFASSK